MEGGGEGGDHLLLAHFAGNEAPRALLCEVLLRVLPHNALHLATPLVDAPVGAVDEAQLTLVGLVLHLVRRRDDFDALPLAAHPP